MDRRPVVLERVDGHCGELVLRRHGTHFEVIANGVFLMDTRNGESERLLVAAAARRLAGACRLLIGGLGVGFSLAEALATPAVSQVVVVEREPAVIDWVRGPLAAVNEAVLDDPRVCCVRADLLDWLASQGEVSGASGAAAAPFDAICLDIDNGPNWTVSDSNQALYDDGGLRLVRGRLRAGGVLAVWSAAASPEFEATLRGLFGTVETMLVPVPRGEPDVIYLAS